MPHWSAGSAGSALLSCTRSCGSAWAGDGTKYDRAAELVRNARLGRQPVAAPTRSALIAQRLYHHPLYVGGVSAVICGALLLAAWEPPATQGAGLPLTSGGLLVVRLIDALFLLVVAFDLLVVQRLYYGTSAWRSRGWTTIKAVLLVALVLNLVLTASLSSNVVPYIMRAARPVFLIERFRSVRQVALNVVRTVGAWANVMILLALHILCFSVLGYALFAGVDGTNCVPFQGVAVGAACSAFDPARCSDYFNTLENSAMQLFQLITLANYPAVAYGVWTCNHNSALYFVAYVVLGVYMLLSLTLAVTVAAFQKLMAREVVAKYDRMFTGFDLAFDELATRGPGGGGKADGGGGGDDGGRLQRADFLRFFGALRPDVEGECAALFFDVFDDAAAGGRGGVDKLCFRRLMLNFGALKVRRRRGGVRAAPSRDGGGGGEAGGGSGSRRGLTGDAPADDGDDNDDDNDDDDHDLEVLMTGGRGPRPPASTSLRQLFRGSSIASSTGSSSSDASVVANPLSAAVRFAGGDTNSPSSSSAADSASPNGRLLRVASARLQLQNGGGGGGGGDDAAAASAVIPAWGGGSIRSPTPSPSAPHKSLRPSGAAAHQDPATLASRCASLCASLRWAATDTMHTDVGSTPAPTSHHAARTSARASAALWINSLPAMLLFDAAVLLNSAAVLTELTMQGSVAGDPDAWGDAALAATRVIELVCLGIFVVEVVTRAGVMGPRRYWRSSAFAKLDVALVALAVAGTVADAAGEYSEAWRGHPMIFPHLRFFRT